MGENRLILRCMLRLLKSISEMPFYDLVAAIEGEDAAATMGQTSATANPSATRGNSLVAASNSAALHNSLLGGTAAVSMSCPPAKQGY